MFTKLLIPTQVYFWYGDMLSCKNKFPSEDDHIKTLQYICVMFGNEFSMFSGKGKFSNDLQ